MDTKFKMNQNINGIKISELIFKKTHFLVTGFIRLYFSQLNKLKLLEKIFFRIILFFLNVAPTRLQVRSSVVLFSSVVPVLMTTFFYIFMEIMFHIAIDIKYQPLLRLFTISCLQHYIPKKYQYLF